MDGLPRFITQWPRDLEYSPASFTSDTIAHLCRNNRPVMRLVGIDHTQEQLALCGIIPGTHDEYGD